jgi:hypothetical protein
MAFSSKSLFKLQPLTKNIVVKMESKLAVRYINNYLFTHAYTRASHFIAMANKRYSFNKFNF